MNNIDKREYVYQQVIKAEEFATNKHNGQFDKNNKPYVEHVKTVAHSTRNFKDDEDYIVTKQVGLLHDTLEDTETTYNELVSEFGQSVADHVNMLTRREDMSYMDYINSLKYNEVCRKVKIADLLHNMDLTRLNKITKEDIQRNRKYLKALEVLIELEG